MKASLEYIEDLSPNLKTFWFQKPDNFDYIAGQFIELTLPHQADSRGQKRWFTLSSYPDQNSIAITTKFSKKPSSFKSKLLGLEPGANVDISDTMGDFVLPKNQSTPLVFVAGGIGITPFKSMISQLESLGQKRSIVLLYSAKTEEDLVFLSALKKGCKVVTILQDPPKDWSGLSGKLAAKRIQELVNITDKTKVYLSGPEKMVESITNDLKKRLNPSQVITDYFPGYSSI